MNTAIADILAAWNNPGTVIALVEGDTVLLSKGYGTTRLDGGEPVTPSTLTSVASVTKPFTSVALAMLVADGKLEWDEPVRRVIPEFYFVDQERSESTSVADLMSHQAGLPNIMGDLWSMDYSIADVLRDLLDAEPVTGLRERTEYSQVGMALIGEIVHRASGMTFSEFVQTRILEPLEMSSSIIGTREFLRVYPEPDSVSNLMGRILKDERAALASGPWQGPGQIYVPAGGLVTTGEDMIRFMQCILAGGMVGDESLIPNDAIAFVQQGRGELSGPYRGVTNPFGATVKVGMGWFIHEFQGHQVVEHPGSNFGSSVVSLVPDTKVGVFISSAATFSMESDRMVSALKFAALSYALGLPQRDWIAAFDS